MLSRWSPLAYCPSFAHISYVNDLVSLNVHFLFNTRYEYHSQCQEWEISYEKNLKYSINGRHCCGYRFFLILVLLSMHILLLTKAQKNHKTKRKSSILFFFFTDFAFSEYSQWAYSKDLAIKINSWKMCWSITALSLLQTLFYCDFFQWILSFMCFQISHWFIFCFLKYGERNFSFTTQPRDIYSWGAQCII